MNVFQAFILGTLQGLTEFLPVSSSGHLIVIPNLLGWGTSPLVFDVMLHLGTAGALVIFFFKDLWNIFVNFIKDVWTNADDFDKYSDDGRMGLYILIGSVPAGILGLFFESEIENVFRDVWYVALFLVLGSVLMYFAEKSKKWLADGEVTYFKSLVIGLFQSFALLPGFSRSGSSISGGMLLGLNREKAAKFSFLLSVPIVVLAGIYKLYQSKAVFLDPNVELYIEPIVLLMGFLSSFGFGILAIKFLLDFLKRNSLNVFVIYRIILAAVLLIYFSF